MTDPDDDDDPDTDVWDGDADEPFCCPLCLGSRLLAVVPGVAATDCAICGGTGTC